jgi:hypothetical protein
MGLKKVYWIQLVNLVVHLCRYWQKHKAQMPTDLPANVKTALDALTLACDALLLYDKQKARGEGV